MQKYKEAYEDNSKSEPASPQSSSHSRSPSPEDVLERVAADVKAYEQENLDTFEANIKAKHNLLTQEKDGTFYYVVEVIIKQHTRWKRCKLLSFMVFFVSVSLIVF